MVRASDQKGRIKNKCTMITKQQVDIFRKYKGDVDAFARCATQYEAQVVGEADWLAIDDAIQGVALIQKGVCSSEYKSSILEKINESFDVEALSQIVEW